LNRVPRIAKPSSIGGIIITFRFSFFVSRRINDKR
jgi:hypothetical protein